MRSKFCLTAADARLIAAACRAEAERAGWLVTIAIVDDGGHLLHLERLDAKVPTIAVATGKARTAALTHAPSAALANRIKDNPALLALDAMPLQGGVPVIHAGQCVGGIGVSGVLAAQDEQVANAGCAALMEQNK
jgi:glc operon protein GlcG